MLVHIAHIYIYALSASAYVLESIKNIINKEKEISLSGLSFGYEEVLKYLKTIRISPHDDEVLFIDDDSQNKFETVDFLFKLKTPERINTIIYTGSNDYNYLRNLALINVKAILHKKETTPEKFKVKIIDTIKFVNDGLTWYDDLVVAALTNPNWIKNDSRFITGIRNLKSDVGENSFSKLLIPDNTGFSASIENIKLLSHREKEILLKVAEGKENSDIANEIYISAGTIVQHKVNIRRKLKLKSAHELSRFAYFYRDYIQN